MEITFLGSGDAFGSGGRLQTCIHVEAASTRVLIDCGTTASIGCRRFGIDPNLVDLVLVSHLHGDHFGGLPFLLLDAQFNRRRERPLTVAGPPTMRERLDTAMECLFPGSTGNRWRFPLEVVEFDDLAPRSFGPVRVTPFPVRHASGAPPMALRIELEGRTVTYTGDTEWIDSLIPAARDADLLIAEAYFAERKVRFHLDLASLAERLPEIRPKRVVLTHMSDEMLAGLPDAAAGFEIADDGRRFTL